MSENKYTFADGFYYKSKEIDGQYGKFEVENISLKVDKVINFLNKYKNKEGYVNLQLKKTKEGNKFLILNEYKKTTKNENVKESKEQEDDLPF